jgi:hypothetical protein
LRAPLLLLVRNGSAYPAAAAAAVVPAADLPPEASAAAAGGVNEGLGVSVARPAAVAAAAAAAGPADGVTIVGRALPAMLLLLPAGVWKAAGLLDHRACGRRGRQVSGHPSPSR